MGGYPTAFGRAREWVRGYTGAVMSTQRSSTPAPTIPQSLELRDLGDANLRVVEPIKVTWEIVDGTYIADAPEIEDYGVGDTLEEAISDLRRSIVELFDDLHEDRDRLGPALQVIYNTLTRKLLQVDATDGA